MRRVRRAVSEMTKLKKKEMKGVKKIRWIVVSRLNEGEDEREDAMPEEDEVAGDGQSK